MSHASSSSPTEGDGHDGTKQAACFNCKRSKLKCLRTSGASTCLKCQQRRVECVTPAYHVGRHKGVKNKLTGLDKAVHQIEQALKKSKNSHDSSGNIQVTSDLHHLLSKSHDLFSDTRQLNSTNDFISTTQDHVGASFVHRGASSGPSQSMEQRNESDGLALDDAENPLQLLARTSEILATQKPSTLAQATPKPPTLSSRDSFQVHETEDRVLQAYFGRFKPRLDLGDDLDPIDIGLITLPESETLFNYYYQNLVHTRWGLDPIIHTTNFVRSRSAFLFTSILASSARFIPSTGALCKRLLIHCRKLANLVTERRYRSIEIVLAFMVHIPWLSPGEHWADDETSTYLAMALTIALDLSLNKIVTPPPSESRNFGKDLARSDCIDASKALALDGLDDVDPSSLWGKRLLRRRERTWLSLFVLERGVCLARGRNYTLPLSPLVETCDNWHVSELADTWDGSIVSVAVLRRDLSGLIARIRAICDGHSASGQSGAAIVQTIKEEIESFFDRWYATWPFQIGDREQYNLPPYVDIMACHTRLSMYSRVINHPTAPVDVRHFFRAAGLSSALNVLRAAVQGEGQLKSMPNNSTIMISFAACFALGVSTVPNEKRSTLAPSVRNLIAEVADVLERIGTTPEHRDGCSALFARQLRKIVRLAPRSSTTNPQSNQPINGRPDPFTLPGNGPQIGQQHYQNVQMESPADSLSTEPLPFSGMSNDQIDEVINNAGVGLEALWDNFQFDDSRGLDWLDWPT